MKIELTAIIEYAIPEGAEDSKPRQLLSLAESVITEAFKAGAFTTLHAATVRSVQHDSRIVHRLSTHDKLTMAIDRIKDLLKADDGQAYKEAEKFLLTLEKEKNHDKTLGPDFPIYRSMDEIIEEIKPSQDVMRLWLQGRGCFIGSARDSLADARLHQAGFEDREQIMDLKAHFDVGFAKGRSYPRGVPVNDGAPDEVTDGLLRQAFQCGFSAGFAERNLKGDLTTEKLTVQGEAIRDHEQHLSDQMAQEEAAEAEKLARPTFPEYATLNGTALVHQGDGFYYRTAGAWGVYAKHDDSGQLITQSSDDRRLDHVVGLELIECSKEDHDADN